MPTDKILKCPSAVLWDLDGTLIDQTIPIIKCYTHTIKSLGYSKPDSNIIRRSLGRPLASTMELFIKDKDMEEACKIFRKKFPKIMFDGMVVLSGAIKCIKSAYNARIPQAIITNKDGNTIQAPNCISRLFCCNGIPLTIPESIINSPKKADPVQAIHITLRNPLKGV